jgi:hypothetical protein
LSKTSKELASFNFNVGLMIKTENAVKNEISIDKSGRVDVSETLQR